METPSIPTHETFQQLSPTEQSKSFLQRNKKALIEGGATEAGFIFWGAIFGAFAGNPVLGALIGAAIPPVLLAAALGFKELRNKVSNVFRAKK